METQMIKFFLLFLQEQVNAEVVFDKEIKQYFILQKRYPDGGALASPIGDTTDSVMLKQENLITAQSLENSQNNPYSTPNQPRINPKTTPNEPRMNPELSPNQARMNTGEDVEYIGKVGHLYPKISINAPAYLADNCIEIEKLLHSKITKTERYDSLNTAKQQYNEYYQIVTANTPFAKNELESLKGKINKTIKQRNSGKVGEEQADKRRRTYRKLKEIGGTFVVVGIIGAGIYFGLRTDNMPTLFDSGTAQTYTDEQAERKADELRTADKAKEAEIPRKVYTKAESDELVKQVATQNGKEAFAFTKNKVYAEIKDKQLSQWEAKKLIAKHIDKIK